MEDRFKFRFFDKKKQKMMYENSDFSDYCKDEWWGHEEQMALEALDVFDNPEYYILMQSTGLKDKNGKLIYEGDIIKYLSGTVNKKFVKYITKWNDNMGQFYISKINPSEYDNWKDWHLGRHDLDYEIIGNIYENKELLNEI